jgi:hypothetical protein
MSRDDEDTLIEIIVLLGLLICSAIAFAIGHEIGQSYRDDEVKALEAEVKALKK